MAGRNKKFLDFWLFSQTVAYWCMHGEPDNLESLHNKKQSRHYRKATPEYIELLLKTVDKTKISAMNLVDGRQRLATYLAEKLGLS